MSTNYPFLMTPPGGALAFLNQAKLSGEDKNKIALENWERICANIRR